MSFKDDPLQQHHTPGGRTLWLNRENMLEARENWFRAYREMEGAEFESDNATARSQKNIWDTAWAAAIAAFGFMMEGRTEPK